MEVICDSFEVWFGVYFRGFREGADLFWRSKPIGETVLHSQVPHFAFIFIGFRVRIIVLSRPEENTVWIDRLIVHSRIGLKIHRSNELFSHVLLYRFFFLFWLGLFVFHFSQKQCPGRAKMPASVLGEGWGEEDWVMDYLTGRVVEISPTLTSLLLPVPSLQLILSLSTLPLPFLFLFPASPLFFPLLFHFSFPSLQRKPERAPGSPTFTSICIVLHYGTASVGSVSRRRRGSGS